MPDSQIADKVTVARRCQRQCDRYGMVIPNFVRQALAGKPLTVHGTGLQTRSFTWVGDVVWALLALVAEPRSVGEVFNIGNGAEVIIRSLPPWSWR